MYTKTISVMESLIKPPISSRLKAGCVVLKTGEDVGEHITGNKEEILVILKGKAEVVCENETINVGKGTLVFIPKNKKHNVINESKELLKYIYITTPIDR